MSRRDRRIGRAAPADAARWAWERRPDAPGHPRAPKGLRMAYVNRIYSVMVFAQETRDGIVDHLMIRRHDGAAIRSWSDLQRIKNDLAGPDRTAVEVYPPADEVVDQANSYHHWVLPPGSRLGFGLHQDGWGAVRVHEEARP